MSGKITEQINKGASKRPQCKKKKLINNIVKNYSQLEQSIVNQLYMTNDIHGPTAGGAREDIWRQMFETIVPKKFVIESSVFIIDSNFYDDENKRGVSQEVDLAIIDETYTPYIFRYGRLKFVPIEAVAAVVECKSRNSDYKSLKNWTNQIDYLTTSPKGIARIATGIATGGVPTQQKTSPLKIFCGLGSKHDNLESIFDFVVLAHQKDAVIDEVTMTETKLEIIPSDENTGLFDWHKKLNSPRPSSPKRETFKVTEITLAKDEDDSSALDQFRKIMHSTTFNLEDPRPPRKSKIDDYSLKDYEVYDSDNKNISLLTFNFQLNQLLMIINNPLLFPHLAYVDMFKEGLGVKSDNGKDEEEGEEKNAE